MTERSREAIEFDGALIGFLEFEGWMPNFPWCAQSVFCDEVTICLETREAAHAWLVGEYAKAATP